MKFRYSTTTRILTVFGLKMTHIFHSVNISEINELLLDAKRKEETPNGR